MRIRSTRILMEQIERVSVIQGRTAVVRARGIRSTQRGTASARIRSRRRRCKPCSSATSTLRPSASSRSAIRPPGKKGVRTGPASIRRSKSLSGRCSPRAKDQNTRMPVTPCLAAMESIMVRFCWRRSSRVIAFPVFMIGGFRSGY
jgi:hypothetical protein